MTTGTAQADLAVVGAGIVGLAHAYEAARQGRSVVVFERDAAPRGASVRNFGMVLPLGMAPGPAHDRAMRSRAVWLKLAARAGFWHEAAGALVVAYEEDEQAVLDEFAAQAPQAGYPCVLLAPGDALRLSPALRPGGLKGGLFSPAEVLVDPREALPKLVAYLRDALRVTFRFGAAVVEVAPPFIRTGRERWQAERIVVCSGAEFETLFPDLFAASGLVRCKVQMMRTVPQPPAWRMGPMLAGGLSLRHYPSFAACPSLPALRARLAAAHPALDALGIHVMAAQNGLGELVLGDSHEYGEAPSPFDRAEIDALILERLAAFFLPPAPAVAARWHGVYARAPGGAPFVAAPAPGLLVVTGLGGTGMTTAFGLAHDLLATWTGDPATAPSLAS